MYDVAGKLLYKKNYPENTYIVEPEKNIIVADAGTTVVFTESSVDSDEGYWTRLHVYDKKGEELLDYLAAVRQSGYLYSDLTVSSSGRYLAAQERI